MRTILERELCFQEIAFLILAGFFRPGASKKGAFLGPEKVISEAWFGLWPGLASLGLSWPPLGLPLASFGLPLGSLGLSLASPWGPLAALWAPLASPWPHFGVGKKFDLISVIVPKARTYIVNRRKSLNWSNETLLRRL